MPSRLPRGVAIVVHNIDAVGGMERQAGRLAEHLAARGVRVTIVSTWVEPRFRFSLQATKPWYERRGAIEIIRTPIFRTWKLKATQQLFDIVATYSLMRRRRRLDVIYAVQYTGSLHSVLPAEATGLPTVVKFACGGEHGDFYVLAQDEDAERIRAALRRMDRYVIISEEIRREAEEAGLDPLRFVKIRNGVDTKRFSREGPAADLAALGPKDRTKVVLFVGRLDTQKRVDVLIRAFAKVLAKVPEARLACAGSGPRLEEYRALARELGVADKVAFLGARSDVPALHRAASAFALPSAAEGLPNALLEALACGTPSVATAIPGTTDVVSHEKEALLVPLDDADALADALARVLEDEALARSLARAGRERIMAEFDMERVTDQYLALFQELARAKPTSELVLQTRFLRTSLVLLWRLGWLVVAIALMHARDSVTDAVVGTKALVGIEGDIMARLRRAPTR
jgi:glycosyltransferase involved in cell wall biosynthesis